MNLKVSIIVPTYNGARKITGLLDALDRQTFTDFEVIIVIDGSSDETAEVIRKKVHTYPMRTIVQENRGRAASRNNGARAAEGELLIFLDDDLIPAADLVEKHYDKHQECATPIIVTGTLTIRAGSASTDIQKYRSHLDRIWASGLIRHGSAPLPGDQAYLSAANFSILRSLFLRLGGFDEHLRDAEDYDFAIKTKGQGIPIYYDHAIYAQHNDPITCRSYVLRQRQYHAAHEMLRTVRPGNPHALAFNKLSDQNIMRRLFYNLVSRKLFVDIIDTHNIFQYLLPRSLRYKLYGAVIWGLAVHFPERKI